MSKVKIDYAHLHNHSCFSRRDAHTRIDLMVKKVAYAGMKSVALTDHGVMHGIPMLFNEAKKNGVKAIAGCEVYETDNRFEKGKHFHMILLAKNQTGYHNLIKIVSDAFMNGFYSKPRTDWEMLQKHSEGLICTSACLAARIPRALMAGEYDKAKEYAQKYKGIFGDDFYLEIQCNTMPEQQLVNEGIYKLSQELDIEVVATADAHYLNKEDAKVHQAMLCLGRQRRMLNDNTPGYGGENTYYVQTPKEIYLNFRKQATLPQDFIIQAMNNTGKVADKINFNLKKEKDLLPDLGLTKEELNSELSREVTEGFKRKVVPIAKTDKRLFKEYQKRTKYELEVIKSKGYADYFLIVSDFMRFAKSRGIAVGPGRGSAAGSLISYLLDITEVDPIEHGLLFERFLDVTRQKMPDIDVDIEDIRRHEVYEYLQQKYGVERVAQIANYGKMTAKKAFKNALMVYDVPFKDANHISSLIPDELGITIDKAYKMSPELVAMKKKTVKRNDGKTVKLSEVFETAEKFEFVVDQIGKHAAGVLITPGPVDDFFPIHGTKGERVTQYDKDDLENLGGVKFDLLGLKTMNMIGLAVRSIENETGERIDMNEIMRKADDPEVYKLIASGDTSDLFQINSDGMQQLCKKVKPTKFADVVAITALYRPPALASGDTWRYADLKVGKEEITYTHPDEEPITGETYGVITYQEHVMLLVNKFAGWDFGRGDKLRKMSAEQLEELRDEFVSDGLSRNYSEEVMNELWDRIVRYMGYGFNKSHGVSYTMITYATAWLKVHYPTHWLAAQMTVNMGEQEKIAKAFEDIKKRGFKFETPNVNKADRYFTAQGDTIVFPLGTVKGVGDSAVDELLKYRPFTDFKQLLESGIDKRKVSARAIKPLILAGAFDSMYPGMTRKEIMLEYFAAKKETKKNVEAWKKTEWNDTVMAEYEKEYIGVYITKHPMDKYGFRNFATEYRDGQDALMGGNLIKVKTFRDKRQQQMAFVTVETLHGVFEGVVFSNVYSKYKAIIQEGNLVMIRGKKDGEKILANSFEELER